MADEKLTLKAFGAVSNKALKSDELPSRIKILDWGTNKTLDGEILFDEQSAKVFYANQKSIGRTYAPLDFNHNTVPGTQAYKDDKEPRHVAAYGVPTVVPNDGLYYEYLNWTPHGTESAKDYADLSPAVITDNQNRVIGLHSCALTPAGAIENLSFYSADDIKAFSSDSIKKGMVDGASTKKKEEEDEDEKKKKMKACSAEVEFADSEHHKYPIDTEEHVRAAWSYIHMARNQKEYSASDVQKLKEKIAAKAKTYGIELRAEGADEVKVQVDAYVQDPYKGIDQMLDEHVEYFRKALGMDSGAKPDDIMKALRAKWEGMQADKQPIPTETPGASVDPTVRNSSMTDGGTKASLVKGYSAEDIEKLIAEKLDAKVSAFEAGLNKLQQERDAKAKEAEAAARKSLVDEASRAGKVIPLSDEQIGQLPITVLETMVKNLKPEVPLTREALKPMSADGKIPAIVGAAERAASSMTQFFSERGVNHLGQAKYSPSVVELKKN